MRYKTSCMTSDFQPQITQSHYRKTVSQQHHILVLAALQTVRRQRLTTGSSDGDTHAQYINTADACAHVAAGTQCLALSKGHERMRCCALR